MADIDDAEDADVPEQAVAALDAASRRAAEAGLAQIIVRGGHLVEVDAAGRVTLLKEMPGPKAVHGPSPVVPQSATSG